MKAYLVLMGYILTALTFLRGAGALDSVLLPGSGLGPTGPVVGDFNNTPSDGLETALTTLDGTLQVVKGDGTVLWSVKLPNAECPQTPTSDKTHSSPVVGELFGDGVKYIVTGYGGFVGKPCDGGVAAYRASDGHQQWVFSIKRWSERNRFFAFRHAVYGTPQLGDVDGNGTLEIGFGSFDRHIYLLNSNGSVRWYAVAADTVFASPSFVDLNGDGKREMIISTDISKNTQLRPPTPNGGYVYALNASIRVRRGYRFGFRDPKLQMWRAEFDQVMQASPVVGDVIPQSPGVEVVVGSGCFFPQGAGERRGKWFKILSGKTGKVLQTLTTTGCTPTSPALGDLDQDGALDVVGTVSGASFAGGDGYSHLAAWSPSRGVALWDVVPSAGTRLDSAGGHYNRAPIIEDLTGDGVPEILINYSTDVLVFDADGAQLTCHSSPCTRPQFRAGGRLKGYPAVADIDQDGELEIIAAGPYSRRSALLIWENPF